MNCPFCKADKDHLKVIDSRSCEDGLAIRRRRQCARCRRRFTTYERVESQVPIRVVKRDNTRVPFSRDNIITGLSRACYKRPVKQEDIARLAENVEEELLRGKDQEVSSQIIGRMVMERLKKLDNIAYVRFASVYMHFAMLEDLLEEAKQLIEAKSYDVPGQAKLFDGQSAKIPTPRKRGSKE